MKSIRILCAALSVLLLCLSASACGTTLKTGENGLYDDKNDVRYLIASTVYEPVGMGEKYGVMKLTDTASYQLYLIPDTDPLKMLVTEEGDLLHASSITLPTLSEMDPTAVHICMDTTGDTYTVAELSDKAAIDAIVRSYEERPEIENPGYTPTRKFRVRFASPEHPGFYYSLTYVEFSSDLEIDGTTYGRYFLLNIFEGTFAPVDDTIHELLGEEETEEVA